MLRSLASLSNSLCHQGLRISTWYQSYESSLINPPSFSDLQVYFASSTSNGFKSISSSSFSIHKLFRVEIEDDFISKEIRSL